MKLKGLIPIYRGMKTEGIERYKFRYQRNNITFEVFFLIDQSPFKLLFGAIANNFAFELNVEQGFEINPKLSKPIYSGLCKTLNIEYNPNNPFSPKAFFQEFNLHIPKSVDRKQKAKAHEIGRFRRNVEEADKIYFCGWRNNNAYGHNVSKANLEKTKLLLSFKAYEICLDNNISSRWTDRPSDAKDYYFPD